MDSLTFYLCIFSKIVLAFCPLFASSYKKFLFNTQPLLKYFALMMPYNPFKHPYKTIVSPLAFSTKPCALIPLSRTVLPSVNIVTYKTWLEFFLQKWKFPIIFGLTLFLLLPISLIVYPPLLLVVKFPFVTSTPTVIFTLYLFKCSSVCHSTMITLLAYPSWWCDTIQFIDEFTRLLM